MAKYRCVYDGDSFIDSIECETLNEAQDTAMDILTEWSTQYTSEEDHDMMVVNCMTWVEEYDEEYGEWVDIWYPDDDFCQSIGWVERMVKS